MALAVLLSACGRLPVIPPSDTTGAQDNVRRCEQPFLNRPYRLIHSLEATVAGRTPETLLGITLFDPRARRTHSALLTLEGFVLFEAGGGKEVHVERAVPPFDTPRFADNMMEDIRLIFLAPEGRLLETGTLEDGAAVCRYDDRQGGIIDVVARRGDGWEITAYGANHKTRRKVRASAVQSGMPGVVELTGYTAVDYSLRLTLISAEPISAGDLQQQPSPGQTD